MSVLSNGLKDLVVNIAGQQAQYDTTLAHYTAVADEYDANGVLYQGINLNAVSSTSGTRTYLDGDTPVIFSFDVPYGAYMVFVGGNFFGGATPQSGTDPLTLCLIIGTLYDGLTPISTDTIYTRLATNNQQQYQGYCNGVIGFPAGGNPDQPLTIEITCTATTTDSVAWSYGSMWCQLIRLGDN